MNDEINTFSKLFNFNNTNDYIKFKDEITDKLNNSKYKIKKNININNNNNLIIYIIEKETFPNWKSTCYITMDDEFQNKTYYRIVFYKYDNNNIYFEKNGNLKILDEIIKKYNYSNIELENKNITTEADLRIEIENKLLKENKDYINNNIIKNDLQSQLNITDILNIPSASLCINYYDDLLLNKRININQKLIDFHNNQCIDNNNNSSETIYNKNVCENNPNIYINLDRKLVQHCEIADIYDKKNKLLFHNKKIKI